ncbi:glycoside hydrolase family 88 protein [Cryobacterium sp. Y82]|uniref:glycoside hydrolase family 88 protein n=1 Tax=Cryobacterium sp. Y82 TaxID=2045017 RepID=UPI000CE3F403|nr:glycoside hydrolase family 88 protein [Cryobacterium sp. Y82]
MATSEYFDTMKTVLALLLTVLVVVLPTAQSSQTAQAAPAALPSRSSIVQAARTATDYFYAHNGGATSDAGWKWAPYFMGVEALVQETNDPIYRQWLQSWGARNNWIADAPSSPTSNPDSRAAIQVWQDSANVGVNANLAPSDRFMAGDLSLAANRYWWIDSMFMGLPLWPRWATRTGKSAYQMKHSQFYNFLKNDGTTSVRPGCVADGLFDAAEQLWWRDCKYVGQRDSLGHKVMWARGNGWVIGAMARTLMVLPPADPQYTEYKTMLQTMAARLAQLQGSDGMWRSSLLSPSLFPAPETSATALFVYAMAYGIRTGLLDSATYLPVITRAWAGLSTLSLKSSGFLSNCQGVGEAPAKPSTTTSIAYCVGAFTLAASEVARLSGVLASDTFGRTVTGALGSAELGGSWTAATGFSVVRGVAQLTTPPGTTRAAYLNGVSSQDTEVRTTLNLVRPTTGSAYVAVIGRRVGTASYGARVVVAPSGSVKLQIRRTNSTVVDLIVPRLTYAPGNRLQLRLQVTGASPTAIRAKVWKVGTAEPSTWQVTKTDSTAGLQSVGSIGLMVYSGSNSVPAPLVVSVEELWAGSTR